MTGGMLSFLDPAPSGPGPHRLAVDGYDALVAGLASSLARGRAAQAYLIEGPAQVGKSDLARWLAQALLCAAPMDGAPCGHCRGCRTVAEGIHPDLFPIEPPLKVDQVRALLADLALRPVEGRGRVAILPDIDLATLAACNSLLKTLEEPPAGAVLILTAVQPDQVLPTIRSRCRPLAMRPLGAERVAAILAAGPALEDGVADGVARRAGGRLVRARAMLGDAALEARRRGALDLLERTLGEGRAARLRLAAELAREPAELPELLEAWLGWWRDLLHVAVGQTGRLLNPDREASLRRAAARHPIPVVSGVISSLEDALRRLRANASAPLVMDLLLMELPS